MKLKPITNMELTQLQLAEKEINSAYQRLKEGGAVRAATRVKSTLKSVQGAVRHGLRRWNNSKEDMSNGDNS